MLLHHAVQLEDSSAKVRNACLKQHKLKASLSL